MLAVCFQDFSAVLYFLFPLTKWCVLAKCGQTIFPMALVCCFCVLRVCVSDSFNCTFKQNGGKKEKWKGFSLCCALLVAESCSWPLFMSSGYSGCDSLMPLFFSPLPFQVLRSHSVLQIETVCYRLAKMPKEGHHTRFCSHCWLAQHWFCIVRGLNTTKYHWLNGGKTVCAHFVMLYVCAQLLL